MPRFFFHIRQRDGVLPDERGSELPDLEAARREAAISLRHLVAVGLRSDSTNAVEQVEVTDSAGKTLVILRLGDLL